MPVPANNKFEKFKARFGHAFTIFESQININNHLLAGTFNIQGESRKNIDRVLYTNCCSARTQASLINENYFWEIGCPAHSFSPLCQDCQNNKVDWTDLSWEEVLGLVTEKLINGTIKFEARYSFRYPPETIFLQTNSNFEEALKFAKNEVSSILKHTPNGAKILMATRQKYVDSGAYTILSADKTKRILGGATLLYKELFSKKRKIGLHADPSGHACLVV